MTDLSIVIAAYNEEKRLPQTLERLLRFLETSGLTYEFVFVNDGSADTTLTLIERYAQHHPFIKSMTHMPNQGRGFAIRKGVLAAQGDLILETDADGSVADEAITRFIDYFSAHPETDAIFGSRELPTSFIARKQPFLRVFLGYGFIYLARVLFWSWDTTDFTLGFKMFRKKTAHDVFSRQFSNHYVAEAEIVYVTKKRGWKIQELPVTWSDNRDSRVHPFRDSIRSFMGMTRILINAFAGKYR